MSVKIGVSSKLFKTSCLNDSRKNIKKDKRAKTKFLLLTKDRGCKKKKGAKAQKWGEKKRD